MSACLYGDQFCPCQDGDQCHYRPYGESSAWLPPETFWRSLPCGSPPNPVAWVGPKQIGPVCHCGTPLDVGTSTGYVPEEYGAMTGWPLVTCTGCGCHVAVPQEAVR